MQTSKLVQWKQKQETISEQLAEIPDFYLEIKWDFKSNFIPFISHFTPCDTYKIWKMGSSIRLDFSPFVTNKGKSKQTNISLIMRERYLINDPYRDIEFAIMDRNNEEFINILQTLKDDEITQVINNYEATQTSIKVNNSSYHLCKNTLGNPKMKKINEILVQKHILLPFQPVLQWSGPPQSRSY